MSSSNNPIFGSKPTLFKKFLILYSILLYIDAVNMAEERSSAFAQKLYDEVLVGKPNENTILSPFSIETCIAMARMGAQGQTAEEIDKSLGFATNTDATQIANAYSSDLKLINDVPYINIANRIYVKDGYKIHKTFNEILTKQFYSDVKEVDFVKSDDAAQVINDWVETKTNNRIKNLVSPSFFDELTRIVLINAIHFKANWQHEFIKSRTQNENFYLNENDHVTVRMMFVKGKFLYGEIPELDATAIELPYTADSGCSMFIILPNSRTGLKDMEKKLKDIPFQEIRSKMSKNQVAVKLPKFKTESMIDLNEPLMKLGMKTMFGDKADFTKMLENPEDLKVSKVVHKAFIEVNEEGTEAAAATAGVIRKKRSLAQPTQLLEFTADHPFFYKIIYTKPISDGNNIAIEPIRMFVGSISTLDTLSSNMHDEL